MSGRPAAPSLLASERGVALPMALLILLILAGLALALAQLTEAELDVGRLTRWDLQSQYLAQAAVEHQIYALKENKNAGPLVATNYPLTPGAEFWYSTTLTCLLQCGVDRESRRWEIVATGEVRRPGGGPVLQTRSIRTRVEIDYDWDSGTSSYRVPTEVTIRRWEEVYP